MLDHHMLHAKSLRPLIPRPTALTTRDTMFSANPHTCFLNSYNSRATSFSAWNSHLMTAVDGETGFLTNNVEPLLATPRWNPKPEQIQALEEMYKKGLRTPSAEQIQKIAAKLRKFGKIEGKNVFYWFQNHKARERQKRRRLMNVNNHPQLAEKHDNNIGTNMGLKKPGGINIKCMDVESPKKSTYSTCGSISEDFVSKNITVKAESKTNAWAQTRIKKTTIQMDMSPLLPNYYIFSTRITTQQSSKQPCNDDKIEEKISIRNNQILQLFPLGINNQSDSSPKEMEESGMVIANNMALSPRQFYEFLPLKS